MGIIDKTLTATIFDLLKKMGIKPKIGVATDVTRLPDIKNSFNLDLSKFGEKADPEKLKKLVETDSLFLSKASDDELMQFRNNLEYLNATYPEMFSKAEKAVNTKTGIDSLVDDVNAQLSGKKAFKESVNPKTGEVRDVTNPVKLAEEERTLGGLPIDERSGNIADKIDELTKSEINTFEKQKQYLDSRLEFIDSLDPRRRNKDLDFQRKSIETENRLLLKAEEKGLDFDTFEKLRQGLYGPRKQQTLNFIKTGKVNLEPVKPATTFEQVQDRYKAAAKAADEIFPNYKEPKTAAQELAEVMAEQKYKKAYDQLSGDKQHDLYSEAYDYITSINRLDKVPPPNRIAPPGQEFNISDEKTAEAFTKFAKENDPEGFKKIQKVVDDINNKNILENFDVKGREPNATGGRVGYKLGTKLTYNKMFSDLDRTLDKGIGTMFKKKRR